jgi:prefoldin subunit 5
MTIDERLDRLVERHEALSQSLDLLTADVRELPRFSREQGERIERLAEMVKAHDGQITALSHAATALLEAVRSHERRLERLEGGPG